MSSSFLGKRLSVLPQHHDPVDPEACNIPFTLKLNEKTGVPRVGSYVHTHTTALIGKHTHQRPDLCTVSWM
ncbi:hypothetical protein F7725_018008 [Dissostichus mawsoni]|uniref:Uncharacterized protein n=1 Tax=Dissostichus mawsoni TaxID=36200 RepID=A0A7J5XQS7_DISMA|nr:hypothetical protein F7725_018008 [Dissostichus mawsoni]